MIVRNRPLFALALSCLATSGALGVMLHDGALGMDSLGEAEPGDAVQFKATTFDDASTDAMLSAWSFYGFTVDHLMSEDGLDVLVLHEGEQLAEGTWVVDGIMRGTMAYKGGSIIVVEAYEVNEPLLLR